MNRAIIIIIINTVIGNILYTQSSIRFEKVDFGNFANNTTFELIEDSHGSIWSATEEGLIRHNSVESRKYDEYHGLPEKFSNNIQNVVLDHQNKVWASSENYLARFDETQNKFILFDFGASTSTPGYIYDVKLYLQQLWLATFDGIWVLNLQTQKIKKIFHKGGQYISFCKDGLMLGGNNGSYIVRNSSIDPKPLMKECITSCIPNNGEYIVSTRSGKILRLGANFEIKNEILNTSYPILKCIAFSKESFLAATDGGGIYELAYDGKILKHLEHDDEDKYSIPINGVYDLLHTRDSQLWVATFGGGVVKSIDKSPIKAWQKHSNQSKNTIANNYVRAIQKTQEGDMWYGTKEGISILRKNNTWQHLPSLTGDSKEIILTFYEKGDYIWVGTFGNGAFKINKKNLSKEQYCPQCPMPKKIDISKVYSIIQDFNGTLFFGGIEGNLSFIKSNGELGNINIGQVKDLAMSPSGTVYSAGRQGVYKIVDNKAEQITELIDSKKFDYSTINCLEIDQQGIFWLGTKGDGVVRYQPSTKKIDLFGMNVGMPSDIIQAVILLNRESLWVSTSRGLAYLDLQKTPVKVRAYDDHVSLGNSNYILGSYANLGNNLTVFGTQEGLITLDLSVLLKSHPPKTPIFEYLEVPESKNSAKTKVVNLYDIKINKVSLKYWQDFIKVKFATIDHINPKQHRYKWKMEGINEDWSPSIYENEIYLANIKSGTHKLEIKSVDPSGIEGPSRYIHINIQYPWYFSWWAKMVYFFTTIGLGILLYRFSRTLILKKNAEEQISFYNNITHELKTPLSILLNKLDTTNNVLEYKQEVKSTVSRLNSLFDQLLNFNKVNSIFYKNQIISEINVEEHFQSLIHNFDSEISKKQINVVYENNFRLENFYYKKDILDKVTYNLLSNAVKYTQSQGNITIKLSGNEGKLHINITDNGIGIPKDEQKNILKRYYRARNAINSQQPGTGLGLLMVKNLVELDRGSISFVSEVGLGTSFTIQLVNLKKDYTSSHKLPTIEVIETPTEVFSSDSQPKYKILIVEDNDELRIDLVEKLSEHFSIIAARNGVEGYEKAKSRFPDLIVTDLIMPEMDGNALCKALIKDENTSHIPVFMMTVLTDPDLQVENIRSGVNTYMTKPIDIPLLVAKIYSVLEYKQKLKEKYIHESDVVKATKFKDERDAIFIQELEQFIISRIQDEEISVQDLCKHVGMSRTALYMKMKEIVDHSPQSFIIMTKMNHARMLLLQGGKTVQEVAIMVGFENPKYFSTSFKRQFDMSPSTFLKSLNPE